jgi:hypothetical protein
MAGRRGMKPASSLGVCQETISSQAIYCEGLKLIAPDAIDK